MYSHYRHVMAEDDDDDDDDVFRLKKNEILDGWMDGWMDGFSQPTNQADIKM